MPVFWVYLWGCRSQTYKHLMQQNKVWEACRSLKRQHTNLLHCALCFCEVSSAPHPDGYSSYQHFRPKQCLFLKSFLQQHVEHGLHLVSVTSEDVVWTQNVLQTEAASTRGLLSFDAQSTNNRDNNTDFSQTWECDTNWWKTSRLCDCGQEGNQLMCCFSTRPVFRFAWLDINVAVRTPQKLQKRTNRKHLQLYRMDII